MLLPPPSPAAGQLLTLNVSDSTRLISLTPALRFPGVPGVRVEVNGQVLSRGGDVAADQLEDTTAGVQQRRCAAVVVGARLKLEAGQDVLNVLRTCCVCDCVSAAHLCTASLCRCSNASFLPSAFIMGLVPGSRLEAEVGLRFAFLPATLSPCHGLMC